MNYLERINADSSARQAASNAVLAQEAAVKMDVEINRLQGIVSSKEGEVIQAQAGVIAAKGGEGSVTPLIEAAKSAKDFDARRISQLFGQTVANSSSVAAAEAVVKRAQESLKSAQATLENAKAVKAELFG